MGIGAALLTICAVIFVLPLGLTGHAGSTLFEAAVGVLTISTPVASVLLAHRLWRQGHPTAAVLSVAPLALMAIGFAFGSAGRAPTLSLLLWLDLFVLLVFASILVRFGRVLLRTSPAAA